MFCGAHSEACFAKVACADDYSRIFAPAASGTGPSGLADWPRPFVIRAASLDGQTLQPGDPFSFGLNLFDIRNSALEHITRAFAQWATLVSVEHARVVVDLSPGSDARLPHPSRISNTDAIEDCGRRWESPSSRCCWRALAIE